MSNERVIRTADLSRLEGNIRVLANNIEHVSGQVSSVSQEVLETQSKIEQLVQEFQEYVRKDQLEKNLQLAETRLVKVRQEIETKYGHYSEVRRRTTGILQAVDVSLVKKETIENSTEEHMLAAPRYWLAPALIALASWLNDNKELADKAMMEALRRDDEKTSLFFALVTRRGARYKASREWLDRYFNLQDPHQLEREIVVLIDGFSNGIFGPDARIKTGKQIETWIEELSQKVGFVEEQHASWKTALQMKTQKSSGESYPYLKDYSPTWPNLETSMEGAKLHAIIHDYFIDIFQKEITPSKSIAFAVDALLDTLVSKFDDEELPLRRDERLLSLIVDENGDRDRAQTMFAAEKTLEERISFTQLLTNFAMHPEVSNASLATQKLSIALSKEWIRQAHDDLTAENRSNVPYSIEISIDDWKSHTNDGSNEAELIQSLTEHMEKRKEDDVARVKLDGRHWTALVLGIGFALMGFMLPVFFVLGAVGVFYWYTSKRNLVNIKAKVVEDYDRLLTSCKDILRAVLADVVEWRREYASEDAKAGKVTEFLDSISPEQYSFSSYDNARAVMKS
ncbi:hypothetical protein [Paenibacillus chitinolyticus]